MPSQAVRAPESSGSWRRHWGRLLNKGNGGLKLQRAAQGSKLSSASVQQSSRETVAARGSAL
eukprot:7122005-Pyramimonas_sp.AAC.1